MDSILSCISRTSRGNLQKCRNITVTSSISKKSRGSAVKLSLCIINRKIIEFYASNRLRKGQHAPARDCVAIRGGEPTPAIKTKNKPKKKVSTTKNLYCPALLFCLAVRKRGWGWRKMEGRTPLTLRLLIFIV